MLSYGATLWKRITNKSNQIIDKQAFGDDVKGRKSCYLRIGRYTMRCNFQRIKNASILALLPLDLILIELFSNRFRKNLDFLRDSVQETRLRLIRCLVAVDLIRKSDDVTNVFCCRKFWIFVDVISQFSYGLVERLKNLKNKHWKKLCDDKIDIQNVIFLTSLKSSPQN